MNKKGAILPFIVFSLGFGFLAVRLFFIQIWEHEILSKKVDRISVREKSESPQRGIIFDRAGRVLAISAKRYTFFADPKICKGLDEIISSLKKAGIPLKKSSVNWNKNSSYVPLIRNLDADAVAKIKALEIKGTDFTTEFVRQYPEGKLACHLIGVVGLSGEGLSGVEFGKNKELSGDKQRFSSFRDGRGREISENHFDPAELKGSDIYLTIDRNLQFIAEKELDNACKELRPKKAIIIIQDPNSGEILAMASRPNFDPSDFSKSKESLKNFAISDMFEPGSTFKIVTMAAALEEKMAKPSDVIFCENGRFSVYDHEITDHDKKGTLSLQQVMEYSSNIGMAKLGESVGKEKLYQYIRQFGFGSKTEIDLPGEARGLLRTPDKWSGLSIYILSFGQEIGVTALQVVNAYSAVANGGTLLEPKIIKSVGNNVAAKDNSGVKKIRRVAGAGVIKEIQEMLTGVVERGTGVNAKFANYTVGGKTGTAQKKDPVTGLYSKSAYVSSFCGILPISSPRLTILVVLDEAKGDYWGSSTAAPIFKKVAAQALRYLEIPPDR